MSKAKTPKPVSGRTKQPALPFNKFKIKNKTNKPAIVVKYTGFSDESAGGTVEVPESQPIPTTVPAQSAGGVPGEATRVHTSGTGYPQSVKVVLRMQAGNLLQAIIQIPVALDFGLLYKLDTLDIETIASADSVTGKCLVYYYENFDAEASDVKNMNINVAFAP